MRDYRIDFQNENFDLYFGAKAKALTEFERQKLPLNISRGLFLKSERYPLWRVPFFRKLYVLFRALNSRVFLVIEDEVNGLSAKEFLEFKDSEKEKGVQADSPWKQTIPYSFCLGNKEVMDWLANVNIINNSPAYTYALKLKNESPKKFPKHKQEIKYLVNLFLNFELSKQKVQSDKGLLISEIYILIYLYDGDKKSLPLLYEKIFKHTYGCSRRSMTDAIKKMTHDGTIEKFGGFSNREYRITLLGTHLVNEILHKYVFI